MPYQEPPEQSTRPLGQEPSVPSGSAGLAGILGLDRRGPTQLLGWLRPELYGYAFSG